MQRAAHAFADHIEEARRLSRDQHVALAEHVAVDQRRTEIFPAAFVVGMRLELHAMLLREVIDNVGVLLCEIVAALEADADDLLAVPRMAPRVMTEPRVKPEMEVLVIERAIDDAVEFLADEEPGDLLRVIGV